MSSTDSDGYLTILRNHTLTRPARLFFFWRVRTREVFMAPIARAYSSSTSRRRGWCRHTSSDGYFDVDLPSVPVGWSVTPPLHAGHISICHPLKAYLGPLLKGSLTRTKHTRFAPVHFEASLSRAGLPGETGRSQRSRWRILSLVQSRSLSQSPGCRGVEAVEPLSRPVSRFVSRSVKVCQG